MWLTSPDFDKACVTGFIAAGFLADFDAAFFFIAMDQRSPAGFLMMVRSRLLRAAPQAKRSGVLGEKAAGEPLFQGFFCELPCADAVFAPFRRPARPGGGFSVGKTVSV
jgi:hypothetical protein